MSRESVVGEFLCVVAEDRWWWSETMYEILGFEAGEVVPTTALLRRHEHPGDAQRVEDTFRGVLATGGPYSCYCRLVDARRRVRHVVVVGDAVPPPGPSPEAAPGGPQLRGYLVDMTEARRRDAAAEAEDAVRGAVEHRAAIEQAKGVLMFVYGVDDTAAFALLRGISQRRNVKVSRLAYELISAVTANPSFPLASRRLTELLGTNAGQDDVAPRRMDGAGWGIQ